MPDYISIHAPSRERLNLLICLPVSVLFQSTLPRGSDRPEFLGSHSSMIFQSTLPRGSDITSFRKITSNANFNPRSLAGATRCSVSFALVHWNFNPRSLAGATESRRRCRILIGNFNPRSLAGATITRWPPLSSEMLFQSTLPRGSDQQLQHLTVALCISIHAPSRERRR